MKEINKYVGRRIREAREDAGLSQAQLGKALSFTPGAISHFEKATRPIRTKELWNLAKIVDKPVTYFFPNSTLVEPFNPMPD